MTKTVVPVRGRSTLGITASLVFGFLTVTGFVYGADSIKVGVANHNLSNLSVGVAQKRGFFKEEGIECEIVALRTNVVIAALVSGELDYTSLIGSIVGAAAKGSPLKLIAVSVDRPPLYFVSHPRIKTVNQLKGSTFGIGSYGTNVEIVTRRVVKHFGIDPEKEIRVLALGPSPARLAALQQGVVDVVVVAPPDELKGKKMGFNVLVKTEEIVKFPYNGMATSVRKLEQQPDEVKRVVKAIIKANRFIRNNREGTVQVLIDWAKATREDAVASYDSAYKSFGEDGSISDKDIRTLIENMMKDAKSSRPILPSDVADLNPLYQAQRELGIGKR